MAAKRLLVSLNEKTYNEIINLAKINNSSSSKIAKNLIMASLELEEDEVFSKLADKRLTETKHWVNHEDAWK
ncbi:hypothetical protein [Rickettsia endosymbiont of Halotydeus destructor]|uniref:hypothetical protein n=1 Tax=Rickettsia endosymbiont of Halotydeus destructor TaxID=2996754 RepID=UPI003BAE30C6